MVLLIDNYDSFTYNLYDYIKQLDIECKVVRNDELNINDVKHLNPTSIIISPGPGIPINAGITMDIIKHFHKTIPILGICLGHQAIGEYFGASLVKAYKPMHGKTSLLNFKKHDLFNSIEGSFNVMRYHSLTLKNIPKELELIAYTKDNEVMAISHQDLPIIGIQFHPESILTENGLTLIKNFFSLANKK